MRLDKYLLTKFSLKSRTYAENLIKTKRVLFNGAIATKTSIDVKDSDTVQIIGDEQFASQGAYKLEKAFEVFPIDVADKSCADIGCSNGGFTDCLLRHGAKSVLAIDVAECALPSDLLDSGQVTFLRANARELPNDISPVDYVCSDVSFISLSYIMNSVYRILKNGGEAVLLIKPQFELKKSLLNKNGIVTNEKDRLLAIENVKSYALKTGFVIKGLAPSPVRFEHKNREYLLYIGK